jgi:hypothetical protein
MDTRGIQRNVGTDRQVPHDLVHRRRGRWQAAGVPRRGVALRALAGLAAVIIGLAGVAQLVLPPLATDDVRDAVGRYGSVQSVSISVWPALTLLWRSAGSLRVAARHLALTPARSAQLLSEAAGIDRLDVTVGSLREGPLQLRSVRVRKRGPSISAEAVASAAALDSALPGGGVSLLTSEGGAIRVSVPGSLFGRGGVLRAVVRALDGKLVLEAPGARLDLFSDARLRVTAIGYSPRASGGYRLWLTARLA